MKTLKHLFITIVILLFNMIVYAQDSYGVCAMDPTCVGAEYARAQRYVERVTTIGAKENLDYSASGPVADGSQYVRATNHVLCVEPGQSITMTIKAADFDDGLKWCIAGGWLDLDASGDFNHPGTPEDDPLSERIFFVGTARKATPEFQYPGLTFTFNIPENASPFDSRLRIVFVDAWRPLETILPVGLYEKSFTIDFTVKIVPRIVIDKIFYGITDTLNKTVAIVGNEIEQAASVNIPSQVSYNGVTYRVTSIGDSAFSGCTGLTSVTIPNSVTSIGRGAFDECTNLKELRIEDGGTILDLGYNSTNKGLFYDCPLETLYLGRDLSYDTSSSYGNSPFYNIKTLKSVTIGNSVTSIGDSAYYGCSNLKKAIWLTNTPPAGYKNVGATTNYVANDQYSGLSNVKVYPYLSSLFEVGGVKYVPVSPAERTCDAIDCVYDSTAVDINIEKTVLFKGIAMNVKQVMPYAFYGNIHVKTLKVENDGVVGKYAFNGCTSLATATISNNGSVEDYAFNGCTSLATAIISNNGGIGNNAFSDCSSLVTATLGDSIASIGASAFYGCSKLSEIVIPDAVTAICSEAFENCKSLETVKVGNGTKSIDSYAFGGCSALISITLGDSVASIGSYAFDACSSLPEIVIPQSVTKIDSYVFDGCTALADVIIEDRTTALLLGSNGSSPLFSSCPLDSVYIGGKITYSTSSSFGYSPFYRNSSLRSVVITDTEEEVYDNEFYGCSNLKNVSIGNGVKKIGNWAFSGCSALDYFAFGNSVQSIGEEAFSDCNNVTKLISFASTPPVCGTQALDDINKWNCTLYVPNESKSAYQSAEQWKEFFFVEDLPTAIVSVLPDYKIQEPVYYDLQGRKVDNPTNGIYIVNGKKVFVK